MPQMDDGPTDGPPGRSLRTVWVTLTAAEAVELHEALGSWAEEIDEGYPDPGWHTHITDTDQNELTVSVTLDEADGQGRPAS